MRFSPIGFCFCAAGLSGDRRRNLLGLDLLPLVGRICVFSVTICQPELVRLAEFTVARPTCFGSLDKSQRNKLPQSWRDRVTINTKASKVLERARQAAVFLAPMIGKFDLKSVEDAPCTQA